MAVQGVCSHCKRGLKKSGRKKDVQHQLVLVENTRSDWSTNTEVIAEKTEQQGESPEWSWLKCDEEIESSASSPNQQEKTRDEEEPETTSQEDDPRYLYPHFNASSLVSDYFEVPAEGCNDLPYPEVEYIRPNCYLNNFFTGHPRRMVESHFFRSLQNCSQTHLSNSGNSVLEFENTQSRSPGKVDPPHLRPVSPIQQLEPPPTTHVLSAQPNVDEGEAPPGNPGSLHVTELDHYIAMLPQIWQDYDQTHFEQAKLPVLRRQSNEPCSSNTDNHTRLRTPRLNETEAHFTSDESAANALRKSTDLILDELLGICATPSQEVHPSLTSTPCSETKRQKMSLSIPGPKSTAETVTSVQARCDTQLDAEVSRYTQMKGTKTVQRRPESVSLSRKVVANNDHIKKAKFSINPQDSASGVFTSSSRLPTTDKQTVHPWSTGMRTPPCTLLGLSAPYFHPSVIQTPHGFISTSKSPTASLKAGQDFQPFAERNQATLPHTTFRSPTPGPSNKQTQAAYSSSRPQAAYLLPSGLVTPQQIPMNITPNSSASRL